jgi:hypothetical protein
MATCTRPCGTREDGRGGAGRDAMCRLLMRGSLAGAALAPFALSRPPLSHAHTCFKTAALVVSDRVADAMVARCVGTGGRAVRRVRACSAVFSRSPKGSHSLYTRWKQSEGRGAVVGSLLSHAQTNTSSTRHSAPPHPSILPRHALPPARRPRRHSAYICVLSFQRGPIVAETADRLSAERVRVHAQRKAQKAGARAPVRMRGTKPSFQPLPASHVSSARPHAPCNQRTHPHAHTLTRKHTPRPPLN